MRAEYLDTYPYLDFHPDLGNAPARLWLLLGEAKSKCDHISGAPLLPEVVKQLHRVYLIKGAMATTAIEGNTLTEEEVSEILDNHSKLPPSRKYQGKEVRNVIDACNQLPEMDHKRPITLDEVKLYNRWVLDGLELEEGVVPGEIRSYAVTVGGEYRPPGARHLTQLMNDSVDWLNNFPERLSGDGGTEQHAAILKAILAHLYLVWIHPFEDGNGRTARLLEWKILLAAGLPTPAAHLLSNHYNLTRSRYYEKLGNARRKNGVASFVLYTLEGFVDGLKEQIRYIQDQQMTVMWENLVRSTIPGSREADERKREIALALSREKEPVSRKKIEELTPKLARLYARKTEKTLTRDLIRLVKSGLLVRDSKNLYRIYRSPVLELLPRRVG